MAEDIYALHLDAPLDVVEPDRASLLATAFAFDATVYDAAYISLAQSYDCSLVTAERTTAPWIVKLGQRAMILG